MGNTSDKAENNNNINSDDSSLDSDRSDDASPLLGPKPDSRNRRRLLSLAVLAMAEFLGGATLSILAPFYSEVATAPPPSLLPTSRRRRPTA
jgi:hypothetical protein